MTVLALSQNEPAASVIGDEVKASLAAAWRLPDAGGCKGPGGVGPGSTAGLHHH